MDNVMNIRREWLRLKAEWDARPEEPARRIEDLDEDE